MTVFDMLEKLGYTYIGSRSRTTDEMLDLFDMTVDNDGEILDARGNSTGYWYEDLL